MRIKKCNEMLDVQFKSADGKKGLSVAEEMKLLSADISLYFEVLDSLSQFQL